MPSSFPLRPARHDVLLDLRDMRSLSSQKPLRLPFTVLKRYHSRALHRRTSLFRLRDRY